MIVGDILADVTVFILTNWRKRLDMFFSHPKRHDHSNRCVVQVLAIPNGVFVLAVGHAYLIQCNWLVLAFSSLLGWSCL